MQDVDAGLGGLATQSVRELETYGGLRREIDEEEDSAVGRHAKVARTGGGSSRTRLRHVATEQRRRDRINEGLAALEELLPHQEKVDKATFLMNVVDYVKQLQDVMRQLLERGALSSLPEEDQWNVRVMLLCKNDTPVLPATVGATALAQGSALGTNPVTTALLAVLLNSNQSVQGQSGLDLRQLQMLLQANLAQQMQAQHSITGKVLQTLQMQQLIKATSQALGSAALPAEAGTLPISGASAFAPFIAPEGLAAPAPTADGCGSAAAAQLELGSMAAPKAARKSVKVRRHSTAAKIGRRADGPAQMTDIGRPMH